MSQIKKDIAINIKRCRVLSRRSQYELAVDAGLREQQISRWETGQSLPSLSAVAALARALECTVDELLAPVPDGGAPELAGGI